MATINYNGMEKLEEITETKVFDEPDGAHYTVVMIKENG